jgi:hypothetical protein
MSSDSLDRTPITAGGRCQMIAALSCHICVVSWQMTMSAMSMASRLSLMSLARLWATSSAGCLLMTLRIAEELLWTLEIVVARLAEGFLDPAGQLWLATSAAPVRARQTASPRRSAGRQARTVLMTDWPSGSRHAHKDFEGPQYYIPIINAWCSA